MTDTTHTCLCDDRRCPACDEEFAATPAGIVRRAVDSLATPPEGMDPRVADKLADLLQLLSDDMADQHTVEKEFPNHIPSARWQVVGWYGRDPIDYSKPWDEALAVARAVLGEPDPNAVAAGLNAAGGTDQ